MINDVLERSGTMVKSAKLAKKLSRKPKKKAKDNLSLLTEIARSIQGLQ